MHSFPSIFTFFYFLTNLCNDVCLGGEVFLRWSSTSAFIALNMSIYWNPVLSMPRANWWRHFHIFAVDGVVFQMRHCHYHHQILQPPVHHCSVSLKEIPVWILAQYANIIINAYPISKLFFTSPNRLWRKENDCISWFIIGKTSLFLSIVDSYSWNFGPCFFDRMHGLQQINAFYHRLTHTSIFSNVAQYFNKLLAHLMSEITFH